MQLHEYSFRMAQPVWETGTAHTMNRTVSFCTDIPLSDLPAGQQIRLAAAASCSFVLLVNGQFVAHGPARCAHGFFRVDEYDLTPYLTAQVTRRLLLRERPAHSRSTRRYRNGGGGTVPVSGYALLRQ